MPRFLTRLLNTREWPSYVVFFVTARCNAACKMCFYKENMDSNAAKDELTLEEYEKIAGRIPLLNVLGISGGEPFLRQDLSGIVDILYRHCAPAVVDLPTNGYFPEQVREQTERILRECPGMIVDVQLSIDGPPDVHNDIRGLKDGYRRVRETYRNLVPLKKRYRNFRLKACVVYSAYNQDHMVSLFDLLRNDFPAFDRVVFSVAHGSVCNADAMQFNWEKYFRFCEEVRAQARVNRLTDVHSLFTMALRVAKNDFLKEVLRRNDMYKTCRAGQAVIVINETGAVFPCEPLWQPVGQLRENGYDLKQILLSDDMKRFKRQIKEKACTCHWGLPMSNTLMLSPRYYPKILSEMARIAWRSRSQEL